MAGVTTYTEEQAEAICEWIAHGKSLVSFCKRKGAPGYRTVMTWLKQQPAFQADYATAHKHQADYLAEEIIDLADKARMGTKTIDRAGVIEKVRGDMVDRSRLQIEARKWRAGKLLPTKYGDKIELAGAITVSKAPTDMTDDDLRDIIAGRKAAAAPDAPDA